MAMRPAYSTFAASVLLLAGLASTTQTAQNSAPPADKRASPGLADALFVPTPPEQPVPFSHKLHVAQGLDCAACHTMPEPGEQATFPATATCMSCHATIKTDSPHIRRLASYPEQEKPLPWVRVYRLPDYVWFSHKEHLAVNSVTCENCHGKVQDLEVMKKVKDLSMASCMDCHKETAASNACSFCHEPNVGLIRDTGKWLARR
jgi:hypothetical protein